MIAVAIPSTLSFGGSTTTSPIMQRSFVKKISFEPDDASDDDSLSLEGEASSGQDEGQVLSYPSSIGKHVNRAGRRRGSSHKSIASYCWSIQEEDEDDSSEHHGKVVEYDEEDDDDDEPDNILVQIKSQQRTGRSSAGSAGSPLKRPIGSGAAAPSLTSILSSQVPSPESKGNSNLSALISQLQLKTTSSGATSSRSRPLYGSDPAMQDLLLDDDDEDFRRGRMFTRALSDPSVPMLSPSSPLNTMNQTVATKTFDAALHKINACPPKFPLRQQSAGSTTSSSGGHSPTKSGSAGCEDKKQAMACDLPLLQQLDELPSSPFPPKFPVRQTSPRQTMASIKSLPAKDHRKETTMNGPCARGAINCPPKLPKRQVSYDDGNVFRHHGRTLPPNDI